MAVMDSYCMFRWYNDRSVNTATDTHVPLTSRKSWMCACWYIRQFLENGHTHLDDIVPVAYGYELTIRRHADDEGNGLSGSWCQKSSHGGVYVSGSGWGTLPFLRV